MMECFPPFSDDDQHIIRQLLLVEEGIVVYPTETFYALGCAAHSDKAVKRVYQLKKRNRTLPLLVLISDWDMFTRHFIEVTREQRRFLCKHWPGPLTAVLKSQEKLSPSLNVKGPHIGVRMTSSAVAQDLINLLAIPLVGTSANHAAEDEMTELEEVKAVFGNEIDVYINGGKTPGGKPSTVVDMTDADTFNVIREGAVSLQGDR